MAHETRPLSDRLSRRSFLVAAGATGAIAIAGCSESTAESGGGGDDGSGGQSAAGEAAGGSQPLSGAIDITGSSTVFPLATAVAEEFQKTHAEVDISIQSTGSGGGFENFFCPGESDINNASRPIKQAEIDTCASNGVTAHEITVATDALTVVINNANDWATEMTIEQLARIWGPDAVAGQTWADVDPAWPDEEIERFGAAETSGTFDYFTEVVNGEGGSHTQAYEPTENDRTIVQGVQGSEYAIGYFGFSFFFNNPDQVTAVAVDSGTGPVAPSLDSARSGAYAPLARPLFTYASVSALAEAHVAEFCRFFVRQSSNQELVANQVGYVPRTDAEMQASLEALEAVIEGASG